MNKGKIAEELNGWAIRELDASCSVEIEANDLKLFIRGYSVAWFYDFERSKFDFTSTDNYDLGIKLIQEDIIKRFYEKGIELLTKHEPKYTVQVIKGNESAYLNYYSITKRFGFLNSETFGSVKTEFTKSEIEEFKKRDDLAIDWGKVIIKEVE